MGCCLIKALEQRRFDFGFLAGNASQNVTLVPVIESCNYALVGIYARVHARTMAVGQSLSFHLFNILPSDTDGREFIETEPPGGAGAPDPMLTVTLTSALPTAVPGIYFGTVSNPGPYLKLVLKATQASSPASFYVETSALVLLRETQ
jgi:hypothetical protein